MATTSVRRITIDYTGDFDAEVVEEASNAASPGQIQIVNLSSGANTITPPTGPTALTIIPPTGNTVLITLKGITGDTGVVLHKTEPSSIGLNSYASTLVLTAASAITGVRLVWS